MGATAPSSASGGIRLSSRIASLFPAGVVAAEFRGVADPSALLADEARWCASFGAKRTEDFAAGRLCSRVALREFGIERFALHVNADRRPAWPAGIVGSISHTRGFCGVALAVSDRLASIGFDAEVLGGVGPEIWPGLFVESEIAFLQSLDQRSRATAATILFSAKEAYYKCHFGITPTWLDFTDVAVTLSAEPHDCGAFEVRPIADRRAREAVRRSGRFAIDDDVVITGVAVARIEAAT